ncbi:MAG: 2-C-methyl-D-erythritol 4-phosphate cytidylyltransferase [Bacteroidetes bacterium]|nr:MAG: 2-C-methyl-D-erythritol 4-phosphate cytidylyltransferase [Bacteroidota bacterium]
MTKHVIIAAGGSGSRFSSEVSKQFVNLVGKPMLMRTIEAFHQSFESLNIIVVLPMDQIEYWKTLCADYNFGLEHQIVTGGSRRFESVKNGLALISVQDCIIGIHDGARPLVTPELIRKIFNHADEKGTAIPVVPVSETLRHVSEDSSETVNRDDFRLVQTPQCFKSDIITAAFDVEYDQSFTDEATVVEASGVQVSLMDGDPINIKITTKSDLELAEKLLG